MSPSGWGFPRARSHRNAIILWSEREFSLYREVSLNSYLILQAGLPRAVLRCRPLNSMVADLIKPIARSAATFLNQTLPLCTRSLQVLSSHHFKAIFSENRQFFISFRMRASRTLGRLLCNLFKNCFLVFPTELGNIAVPKKKKKKTQAFSAQRLSCRTNLCIPFHLGITLSSLVCLYLRHTHTSLFLTQRNYLFSQLHFQEPAVETFTILKFPFSLPLSSQQPFSYENELLRSRSAELLNPIEEGWPGFTSPSDTALTFFS